MFILQRIGDTVTSLKLAFQRHHTSLAPGAVELYYPYLISNTSQQSQTNREKPDLSVLP